MVRRCGPSWTIGPHGDHAAGPTGLSSIAMGGERCDRGSRHRAWDRAAPDAIRDLPVISSEPRVVAVADDIEQIAALLGVERLRPPMRDDRRGSTSAGRNSASGEIPVSGGTRPTA